jgi:hypothetical protein
MLTQLRTQSIFFQTATTLPGHSVAECSAECTYLQHQGNQTASNLAQAVATVIHYQALAVKDSKHAEKAV